MFDGFYNSVKYCDCIGDGCDDMSVDCKPGYECIDNDDIFISSDANHPCRRSKIERDRLTRILL
jgi:hypothetical protein